MRPKSPFTTEILVDAADIDNLGHVNNVIYLRYVQDVATAHWNQVAP
ncbi:MAG: acyl-CoA thioesterase, partial [Cyclobacteriaceae bacterium]|nr:acyl-CoA thioesterase [Cyclobacteriaceae bacterium]